MQTEPKDWSTVFKTFYDDNEAGGSSRWFVSPETVRNFIEQIVKQEKLKVLEEVEERIPHSITPDKEPPKNKLSQNQIFGAGQMNMALRTTELLQALKSK